MGEHYTCESCSRDYGLICLTPTHFDEGGVRILCGSCFGETLLSGYDDKIYLPAGGMASHKDLKNDKNVVYYNVIVW
jgi:hypothetical protein